MILFAKGKSGDIDDARSESLKRRHRYLSTDCHPEAHYHYTLDLRSYRDEVFFSHKEESIGPTGLPYRLFRYFYCPVLSAQVRLIDGTDLSLTVERLCRLRIETKFRSSGKVKTKEKIKYYDTFIAKIKLPKGPSVTIDAPDEENKPHRPFIASKYKQKSDGGKISTVAVQKNASDDLNIDGLLQLLASTFRQVHLQRNQVS